jgi:leucyl aminopeptidase
MTIGIRNRPCVDCGRRMIMQIKLQLKNYWEVACDLLAYPVFEDEAGDLSLLETLNKITRGAAEALLTSGAFKPELHKTSRIYNPAGLKTRCLLLVGAGKKSQFEPSRFREVVGAAVRHARTAAGRSVAFLCRGDLPAGLEARLAVEGACYANFESNIYKTRDKESIDVETFQLLFDYKVPTKEIREAIRRGTIVGEATNFTRTLVNEPSNILTPSGLADHALKMASKTGLRARVLERKEMEKLGMNALLAVSRGSQEVPKLIILETHGESKKRKGGAPLYALVGKGVTFDSGGISIKPAAKMEEMKADMAGGAAVLGAMMALAQISSPHRIMGLIPAVENLPSGSATKPGDVVRSYLGKTIEIINTDAEGRLILADALAYARKLGASHIIDIATLTGACVVALGHVNAGMMGTDQNSIDQLRKNCGITGEGLWQLPLDDAYRKAIRSEIADIKNIGDRSAGTITAAKFLQEFVEDTPWVHLDIAGMDLDTDGRRFACKGATGFGVRTFVQLLE